MSAAVMSFLTGALSGGAVVAGVVLACAKRALRSKSVLNEEVRAEAGASLRAYAEEAERQLGELADHLAGDDQELRETLRRFEMGGAR